MEKYNKVWGETAPIFFKNNVESHLIDVKPWCYCSKHHHVSKYNMFLVLEGELWVSVWKSYGLVDTTKLVAGQSMTIAPGEQHRFETRDSTCRALEFYWTEISANDIVRVDTGGDRSTPLTNEKSVV